MDAGRRERDEVSESEGEHSIGCKILRATRREFNALYSCARERSVFRGIDGLPTLL